MSRRDLLKANPHSFHPQREELRPCLSASFKNRLRVSAGRHATAIVSNSLGGNQYWKMQIGNTVATYVVPNAIPLPDIEKTGTSGGDFRLPAESRVLLFAGRLS